MKTVLYIVSFTLLSFINIYSQDSVYSELKRYALKGEVMSVRTENYDASRVDGMLVVDKKTLTSYNIDFYDKKGLFVKSKSKSYNENKNSPEKTSIAKYDKNKIPLSYSKYVNDSNLIEFTLNKEFGKNLRHSANYTHIYNSNDSNTIEMWLNEKYRDSFAIIENYSFGKLKSRDEITQIYDSNSLEIENKFKTTSYFMNEEVDKIEYSSMKYNYILFDEKGNWIGREVIFKDESIEMTTSYEKRTIKYYK